MLLHVFVLLSGLLNLNHFASTFYILDKELDTITEVKIDTIPEIFAEGVISIQGRYEFGCTLSKDGKEIYFGVERGNRAEILYSSFDGQSWSNPEIILSDSVYGLNDPMLTPNENRLYFITTLHHRDDPTRNDHDIYYVEKKAGGWSDPIPENENINTTGNEYFISFTKEGDMYFSSDRATGQYSYGNFEIYKSEYRKKEYQKPLKLPKEINTDQYEADVFISPDESYVIFCSTRDDGYGRGDLYISFHDGYGNWTLAQNMGPTINNKFHQLCPFVSADGKRFYYTSNQDIMVVDASILDRYR
ncbi:MAG: hypothetical protein HKN68_05035 [Saprospiraceae bacterium]|nr:hypothetical protein [Saprospiraceae bacterium]